MSSQKLLLIANVAYLAKKGNSLIIESIEVWQYGKVVKNVDHEFKHQDNIDIAQIYFYYSLSKHKELYEIESQTVVVFENCK